MRTIVVTNQKGGSGKTTVARNLAVAMGGDETAVAVLDLDPQGSLTSWCNRREADAPALVATTAGELEAVRAKLEAAGVDLLVVDTPPSVHGWIAGILRQADLVLVPVRPSPDDLDALRPILDAIERAGRPFAFVLSQAKPRTRLAADVLPALAQHGRVCPAVIHDRIEHATAAATGQAVTETAPESKAAEEVRALAAYVRKLIDKRAGEAA